MPRTKGGSPPSRFGPGTRVRVKPGVPDPNFADIPLGGWAGVIREVEHDKDENVYLIDWDQATLLAIHPIYMKRCERDGLEPESMWLGEQVLEINDGAAVPIEMPTAIVTRALSEKDQDDRVCMALGLTSDDPLPEVSEETLLAYYHYLKDKLKFPFKARSDEDGSSLTVHRLPDPKEYDLEEDVGLIVEARTREGSFDVPLAELDDAVGNRKLIQDYAYWFHNGS
ncbi:calcium-binding protein [Singulisphaera rosea]